MSSVRRIIPLAALLVASAAATATQLNWPPVKVAAAQNRAVYAAPASRTYSAYSVAYALEDWRRLRSGASYSFSTYARFLIANPDWPGESAMRRAAERAMQPGEDTATVLAFFRTEPPQSATGYTRLAEALHASGRSAEALNAAREAWGSSNLSSYDELLITTRFGQSLTAADHDRRIDRLLMDRDTQNARRMLQSTTPARRPAFIARLAMLERSPDTERLYAAVSASTATDGGLLYERARYLRDGNNHASMRQLLARPHNFTYRPGSAERWYELMLSAARGAAANGQSLTALQIARQVSDAFPAGSDISLKPLPIRDHYTSLVWLAGTTAFRHSRPAEAAELFRLYSRGGRSLQVMTKGLYWAGRAANAAQRSDLATAYFGQAAAYPDQFYGQLALERLGRRVSPPTGLPSLLVTPERRSAFEQKRLVQAVRLLGRQGRWTEQTLFVRALAESLVHDEERGLAVDLAGQIGRPDLAVWTARAARNNGVFYYVRSAYPLIPGGYNSVRLWSVAHGITRQESSFDRAAISHAGARGMMQLMLPTAREQAGKMGVRYDYARLTTDPSYNVMLGSAYFSRLLTRWDGNYPLAVASYNAGSGNVAKWIRANGDPRRSGADIVSWIEAIPFTETRGYVQRVLENTVVYDRLNPSVPMAAAGPHHLSSYLGKSRPG